MQINNKIRHYCKRLIAECKLQEGEGKIPTLVVEIDGVEKRAKVSPETVTEVLYAHLRHASQSARISLLDSDDVVLYTCVATPESDEFDETPLTTISLSGVPKGASLGEVVARMQGESALQQQQAQFELRKIRHENQVKELEREVAEETNKVAELLKKVKKQRKRIETLESEISGLKGMDKTMSTVRTIAAGLSGAIKHPELRESLLALAGSGESAKDGAAQPKDGSPRAVEIAAISNWAKSLPEEQFQNLMQLLDYWGGEKAHQMAEIVAHLVAIPADIDFFSNQIRAAQPQ
jgi:hypothetical protein